MKRCVSLFLACVLVCAALIPTAYAEPTPERKIIYLDVDDTFTIDTGRTIGSDDLLYANWYSSDSSKLAIVGQNYDKDTCDVRALASSGGKTVTVRVEFAENLGDPWLEPVKGVLVYLFVIRGEAPQSITLPSTAEVTAAATVKLTPEFTPKDAETDCVWTSSDEAVATVSDTGVVSGVSKGTAVITAETINGLTAHCTVTVRSANMCGDDLEWSLDSGVLTISGTGAMYDYGVDEAPWTDYSAEITKITVAEGVTRIGSGAFCSSAVSEVVLPESLLEIGDEAFFDCQNLRHISIPSGVRSISGDPFSGYALQSISVSGENAYFSSLDGVLYNKDMTVLVRYPSGKTGEDYCVPYCVDQIRYAAFYNTELKTLYVPETVLYIEYFGISTSGLTVYGAKGSAAEQAVIEYTADGSAMYFKDISTADYTLVRVGSGVGGPGDTVSVPVVLSGNTGFANLNIQISYDTAKLSLQSVQSGEFGALYTEGAGLDTGVYNMSWDSPDDIVYNGPIATLTFAVKDLSGRTPVGIGFYTGLDGSYVDGYDVNYTENYEPLDLRYMSGDISSEEFGGITISGVTAEESLRVSVQLTSEAEIGGVVAAAVYDGDGRLCGLALREAAENVTLVFEENPGGERLAVMWFESLESLRPAAKSKELELGESAAYGRKSVSEGTWKALHDGS